MAALVRPSPSLRPYAAEVISGPAPAWEIAERQLLEAGVPLPLYHRTAWATAHRGPEWWFLAVRDATLRCQCGFAIGVTRSRALPGHFLLRVERFGPALSDEARVAALTELARVARRARVLRVYLDVFSRDHDVREQVATVLRALGFRHPAAPWTYATTVAVDLTRDESAILASFSRDARRNIRHFERHPFVARPITDIRYAPRMDALMRETMARTGGPYARKSWCEVISFANRNPGLSRVVGQFHTSGDGPEALVAFSAARSHGDYVEDYARASTRLGRVSLTHVLVWDLMRWAKAIGAGWYDFGGVTEGHWGGLDPVGGISDFKRSFSKEVVAVGDAWVFEPRPLRALVSKGAGRLWSIVTGQ